MSSASKKSASTHRPIGARTFAAITAVEGLKLSSASVKRLKSLKAAGLSLEQRRFEVRRTYSELAKSK